MICNFLLREHKTPDESKLTEGVGHKQSHPHNRWVSTARPRKNQKLNVSVGYLIHRIHKNPILHKIKRRHVVSCICIDTRSLRG